MKSGVSFYSALCMGLAALSGISSTAYAVNNNISGTVCKNYNAGEALDIDYLTFGVRNINANSRSVVCPIIRSPTASPYSVSGYVDGTTYSGATISCTLSSYNYNGDFLGSQFFSVSGTFDYFVSVTGAYWSYASLLCSLPGSGNGIIYGMDVTQ